MLFSSLSIFIILAVAWLIEMFFRIGVEQRSREIGILQAVGYPLAKIRPASFLREALSPVSVVYWVFARNWVCTTDDLRAHTWWLPLGNPL